MSDHFLKMILYSFLTLSWVSKFISDSYCSKTCKILGQNGDHAGVRLELFWEKVIYIDSDWSHSNQWNKTEQVDIDSLNKWLILNTETPAHLLNYSAILPAFPNDFITSMSLDQNL